MIDKIGLIQPAAMNVSKPSANGATDVTKTFGTFLNDALNSLSAQEAQVNRLNENFIAGDTADVHQLMIEAEKASLGLQLTVQVRNKVIEAYQEIMRTQI